jgi:hypothetical protein
MHTLLTTASVYVHIELIFMVCRWERGLPTNLESTTLIQMVVKNGEVAYTFHSFQSEQS